jgi:chaperone modulatory protein CbpM
MVENPAPFVVHAVVVEEDIRFSLEDLCHACRADTAQLVALVDEGVLQPTGSGPREWRFAGLSLARARAALRLSRDLELGAAETALGMALLDEIEALRARLRRTGMR